MAQGTAASKEVGSSEKIPLDLAEWSYFWVGVERAEFARGTVVNGKQMYVEYAVPRQLRHPYPIVLVHGGGGQGTDWMGTPDGRPGWFSQLLAEGYAVYVVDRPGHGRSPYHPETIGLFPEHNLALEQISGRFTPPIATTVGANEYQKKYHNQWPGTGVVGSPDLSQLVASQGGSYVPAPFGAPGGAAPIAHLAWRERGAMLLDKIGPAIIMTHSAGGPFGWLVAEVRPNLVKGIIAIEGGGQPFAGANIWGMSTIPVEYDPPVNDPSEIKTVTVTPSEPDVQPYKLQAEPARKLKNLQGIPITIVTSEGSFASPGNPGGVAMLKQAGCEAEELRLVDHGVHGNGHMMMVEKNNRQVLQPILDWISAKVEKGAQIPGARPTETALKIADRGYFWVGCEEKKMPYGTILTGQMHVQYMVPQEIRHPFPVVLVHGGGGSMLHYLGLDQKAGWAHYYLQEGYRVFLVDRPGHGRCPYHPDALGPMAPIVDYASVTRDFARGAAEPNKRWPGTGEIGDPLLDQFQAGQNSPPADNVFAHKLWASRGAEMLDKIGPAIIQVHSAGGPFGYIVANERPNLVKAIVNVEGAGVPFMRADVWGLADIPLVYDPPASDPSQLKTREVKGANGLEYKLFDGDAPKLKNLQGIPMVYVTADRSGRLQGPAQVALLKQCGCDAEDLQLRDKGILGNGHFMMLEENRKQVFDVIKGWLDQKVKA
jgi:pimeloyl-ACP methyl ester carboxylesterase